MSSIVYVVSNGCTLCGMCMGECSRGAISMTREGARIDPDKCVGGGMGGVGAAMAAGKRGWKTLLIESMGALGGLATMGLVNIPLDFVSGLGIEMIDELEKIDGHWHRHGHITGQEHPPPAPWT